jgi:hypothetical protein
VQFAERLELLYPIDQATQVAAVGPHDSTVRFWICSLNLASMVLVLIARYGWAKDSGQLTLTRQRRHRKRRTQMRNALVSQVTYRR